MSIAKKIVSLILMALMLMLLIALPKFSSDILNRQSMLNWLAPKEEDFSGVISCWHVVRFKPYSGSMGTWLKKYAKRMEKRHFGAYFEVESISESEAAKRIAEGKFPDIISFPKGFINDTKLLPLHNSSKDDGFKSVRAEAIAASCELMLVYPDKVEMDRNQLAEYAAEYTYEEFKASKAPCCITDVCGAGDIQRLIAANKAEYCDVVACRTCTELVQFIALRNDILSEKIPYAMEYIEQLMSENAQKELVKIGLLPMLKSVPLNYDQSFLSDAYRLIVENNGVKVDENE